ncbi:MAG: hypothetical protein ABI307_14365 [Mycobacterium sp.]
MTVAVAAVLALPSRTASPDVTIVVGDHRAVELVNLGGPPSDELLRRIAANIGVAVEAVEVFWGIDWPRHIVVTATGSDRQFASMAGGSAVGGTTAQWSDIAAVAVADRVDPEHRLARGQRVLFAPGAAEMSTASLRIVLTHELFHYAARADTALDAPRWLTEGVADFVARPEATPPGSSAAPLTLPTDAALATAGPGRVQAYDRAWGFARFVAASYGTARLRELYLAACGVGHADLPTAVREALGTDLTDLLARWRHSPTG